MYTLDKGAPARSKPITFQNGTTQGVDLSFLYNYGGRMRAPVIRELIFEFVGSITGGVGDMQDADACMIYNRVRVVDMGGTLVDLPGKLIRQRMIHHLGERGQRDADQGGNVVNTVTNAAYRFYLRITFDREQSRRGADTALPMNHLSSGSGRIDITFGTPTASTVNSGSVTVYALIHDEGRKELKSRLVTRSIAVTQREDDYRFQGSTAWAILTSNPNAAGQSDWDLATFSTLDVTELEYSSLSPAFLRSEYARCRLDRASEDPVFFGGPDAIPLIWSSSGQRIDKLPDLVSLRVRLQANPPTAAELWVEYIEDRFPALAAEWLGYTDLGRYMDAVNSSAAMVKLGPNGGPHPSALGPIANRLPMLVPIA